MKSFSSVDLYFYMREINELGKGRVESFYYDPPYFYIKIYRKGKGNSFLKNNLGKYLYFEQNKSKSPERHPFPFILYLRKKLKNSYITQIQQIEGERIIKITCEKKNNDIIEKYYLFIELFSSGNVILTNQELEILHVLEKKTFKDRTLKKSGSYELPPKKSITLNNLDQTSFNEKISENDFEIAKFLATIIGIGGKFAREVCSRAGINENKNNSELTSIEREKIFEMLQLLPEQKIEPTIIINSKDMVEDYYPITMKHITSQNLKPLNTFNEALTMYYKQFEIKKDHNEEQLKKELQKLNRRLESQFQQKENIELEYEKLLDKGNQIYESYSQLDELLKTINEKAKKNGWESVLESIKINPKLSKIITSINPDKNEIEIDFNELKKLNV